MKTHRVDFDSLEWQEVMPGLRHKILDHGGRRLRLVEYTPEMKPHWCLKGHIGYVLEGKFEIRYAGGAEVYTPGDGIFIPSGEEHRHEGKALTRTVRIVFVEDL